MIIIALFVTRIHLLVVGSSTLLWRESGYETNSHAAVYHHGYQAGNPITYIIILLTTAITFANIFSQKVNTPITQCDKHCYILRNTPTCNSNTASTNELFRPG